MHVAHITNQEHVIKKKSLDLINHWHILQWNLQKRLVAIWLPFSRIHSPPFPYRITVWIAIDLRSKVPPRSDLPSGPEKPLPAWADSCGKLCGVVRGLRLRVKMAALRPTIYDNRNIYYGIWYHYVMHQSWLNDGEPES